MTWYCLAAWSMPLLTMVAESVSAIDLRLSNALLIVGRKVAIVTAKIPAPITKVRTNRPAAMAKRPEAPARS